MDNFDPRTFLYGPRANSPQHSPRTRSVRGYYIKKSLKITILHSVVYPVAEMGLTNASDNFRFLVIQKTKLHWIS